MKRDPSTGPLSRAEFNALVAAPFGEAVKVIRKHDPLYGLEPGTKIKWEVRFTRQVREEGHATVEAATLKDANRLAENLPANQIRWEVVDFDEDGEIESVEPKVER